MPLNSREEALAKITEYAESAQHSHHGQFSWESDIHNNSVKGYAFKNSNGAVYRVYGPADQKYMTVSYEFDLISHIAQQFSEEDIRRYIDTPVAYSTTENEDEAIVATRAFLDSIESEEMDTLVQNTFERISTTETDYELQWTENESLRRFFVHRKVFPYHEGFTINSYTNAVRSVTTIGVKAARSCLAQIDISDLEPEPEQETGQTQTDGEEPNDTTSRRMFQ